MFNSKHDYKMSMILDYLATFNTVVMNFKNVKCSLTVHLKNLNSINERIFLFIRNIKQKMGEN